MSNSNSSYRRGALHITWDSQDEEFSVRGYRDRVCPVFTKYEAEGLEEFLKKVLHPEVKEVILEPATFPGEGQYHC